MKRLNEIKARAEAATPGPWEADGTGEVSQHWSRPKPWETVVGTDVACMSYCYGGSAKGVERDEDAEFIAHARTDVPALLDALQSVLDLHKRQPSPDGDFCAECFPDNWDYPCPTVTAITTALNGDDQ